MVSPSPQRRQHAVRKRATIYFISLAFVETWTDPAMGQYMYPSADGFALDVDWKPILGILTLRVDIQVDLFDSECDIVFLDIAIFASPIWMGRTYNSHPIGL